MRDRTAWPCNQRPARRQRASRARRIGRAARHASTGMVRHDTTAIGRYTLHEDLGSGGFATVYRAHDPVLDREIALKVLHPHLARDAATRERFVREGRAL